MPTGTPTCSARGRHGRWALYPNGDQVVAGGYWLSSPFNQPGSGAPTSTGRPGASAPVAPATLPDPSPRPAPARAA